MPTSRLPPSPPGHPLLGHIPSFTRERLGFLERCAREYGDLVSFRLGPRRFVLLSHPRYVEALLVTNSRDIRKHYLLRMNRLLLGNGLLVSEGDFWRRQRRLAQPAFQRERVEAYGEAMVEPADRMVAGWRDGEQRDVQAEMTRLTQQIVAKTLFGAEVADEADEVGAALDVVMASFVARMDSPIQLPERFPTPGNLRLQRAVRKLDRIIYGLIDRRREDGADGRDLLSTLLRARDEADGGGMTARQLRDEVMTLFLAGHETTALALSWTWYLLALHPRVETALQSELQSVLGGRSPTARDLPWLGLAERIVTESLRLYPPAYAFGRETVGDWEVNGYRIGAGTSLLVSPWVLHRDSRWFDQPLEFRPERWSNGLARRLPRFAYCPFGGGPRVCLGASFAMTEAILLLATIAQRFRLSLEPGQAIVPAPAITLRPKGGIRVRLERRAPSTS